MTKRAFIYSNRVEGVYVNGVLSKPLHRALSDGLTLDRTPQPRCPRCRNLLSLRSGKSGSFWGCVDYPRCRFTTSEKVVAEAIRRQLLKQSIVSTGADQDTADGLAPTAVSSRAALHGIRCGATQALKGTRATS